MAERKRALVYIRCVECSVEIKLIAGRHFCVLSIVCCHFPISAVFLFYWFSACFPPKTEFRFQFLKSPRRVCHHKTKCFFEWTLWRGKKMEENQFLMSLLSVLSDSRHSNICEIFNFDRLKMKKFLAQARVKYNFNCWSRTRVANDNSYILIRRAVWRAHQKINNQQN